MKTLINLLAGAELGKAAEKIVGTNPLLRSGAAAVAGRIAMRSLPVSLAVIGAGLAYRFYSRTQTPAKVATRGNGKDTPVKHRAPKKPMPARKAKLVAAA